MRQTREQIATELLKGCPDDSLEDHETIAQALRDEMPIAEILSMPETNRWPETYSWLLAQENPSTISTEGKP